MSERGGGPVQDQPDAAPSAAPKAAPARKTAKEAGLKEIPWEGRVLMDAHKAALEKALESSDGACGTTLTACFSLATAYGAAIALIAPKDEQAPLLVLAPFVLLAAGAVVALIGKTTGISLGPFATTRQVRNLVESAVRAKRKASWWAVGLAAAGVVLAGYVVFATYGQPEPPTVEKSQIVFSPAGTAQFANACGRTADSVVGSVSFTERWVNITLDDAAAAGCDGVETLTLPSAAVAYTRGLP
jgi:hypothetical protein